MENQALSKHRHNGPPPADGAGRSTRVPLRAGGGIAVWHRPGDGGHRVRDGIDKTASFVDDRLKVASFGTKVMNHIFPDDWSFLLGEVALYAFVVLILTGVFLTLHFTPSDHHIIYHGSYRPLDGAKVSEAFASTMNISFDVRSGLLFRQMHHWSADIFIGAIAVHMARIFFTSAYRKPRDINWMVGVTMLMLSIANGFLGYSLPDDLLSGNGVRIMASIILSIPLIGSYLMFFFFGGNYPGTGIYIPRMFILHVLIVPGVIIALLGIHLALIFHQEHTQSPKPHRTERNVVGTPLFPMFMAKTLGLFLIVTACIAFLGGFAQIDPIWATGPYETYNASQAAQPDWYMGWIDGALRLFPSWEATFLGHTWPLMVFLPAVAMPLATFLFFYAWPALDRKITRDRSAHHLLVPARDRPLHTAFGVTAFTWFFVLLMGSGTDLIADTLGLTLQTVTYALRGLVFAAPAAAGVLTYLICRELSRRDSTRSLAGVVELTEAGTFEVAESESSDQDSGLAPIPPPVFIEVNSQFLSKDHQAQVGER